MVKKIFVGTLIGIFLLTSNAPVFAQGENSKTTLNNELINYVGDSPKETVISENIGNEIVSENVPVKNDKNPDETLPTKKDEDRGNDEKARQETKKLDGETDGGPIPFFENKKPVDGKFKAELDPTTGAFRYEYPIVVPPGRNGVQPSLSLVYTN